MPRSWWLTADCVRCSSSAARVTLPAAAIALIMRTKMVQVPVNYHPRVGVSSVTGDFGKTVKLGLEMILLVLKMRLRAFSIRRGR